MNEERVFGERNIRAVVDKNGQGVFIPNYPPSKETPGRYLLVPKEIPLGTWIVVATLRDQGSGYGIETHAYQVEGLSPSGQIIVRRVNNPPSGIMRLFEEEIRPEELILPGVETRRQQGEISVVSRPTIIDPNDPKSLFGESATHFRLLPPDKVAPNVAVAILTPQDLEGYLQKVAARLI